MAMAAVGMLRQCCPIEQCVVPCTVVTQVWDAHSSTPEAEKLSGGSCIVKVLSTMPRFAKELLLLIGVGSR